MSLASRNLHLVSTKLLEGERTELQSRIEEIDVRLDYCHCLEDCNHLSRLQDDLELTLVDVDAELDRRQDVEAPAMNAFERHGIDHLSPTSLNLWIASPGLWAARHLLRINDEAGAAAWRGKAVEAGIEVLLRGGTMLTADNAAEKAFELNAQGEISAEIDAERALVVPMVNTAAFAEWPGGQDDLAGTQLRVEHWLDGVPVPLVGYVDFAFMTGIDVDLKTGKACPSKPRADHVRQVAFYRVARKRRGALLYVTCRKSAFFEISDEDVERSLADLRTAARSLERLLGRVENAADALSMLPIDADDYRASPATIAAVAALLKESENV